jgi:hypothetical protein
MTVTLSDVKIAKLRTLAGRLGISPEDLLQMSIEDLIADQDKTYEAAKKRVLKKNKELYRRLS